MKRLTYIIIAAIAAFAILSCSSDKEEKADVKTLKVVKSESTIMPDGGSCTIEVESVGTVTVVSDKEWCTATISGKTITATATPNLTNESRYCLLTIKSGNESVPFSILQYGEVVSGFEALTDIAAPVEGREIVIDVLSNVEVVLEADQTWIHPSFVSGVLTVSVDKNDEPRTRTGVVTYSAGSVSGSFNVMQYPELKKTDDWTLDLASASFNYPVFSADLTVTTGESDLYVFYFIPASTVEGDIDDYIFNDLAVSARNKILGLTQTEGGEFKDYLEMGSKTITEDDVAMGDNYIIAIGFGDNTYVSGLYQYKKVTIEDIRPAYYKWTGKWVLTGKTITNKDFSDTLIISVDETDVDASGKQQEKYFVLRGLCSRNQEAIGLSTDDGHGDVYLIYDATTNSIIFYGQNCAKYTDATYGANSYLQLVSMYVKSGATSYTNVTGGKFLQATASEDFKTASLTILERSAGLPYRAFRMRVVNASGSAYTIGGNDATLAINDTLTLTRAD